MEKTVTVEEVTDALKNLDKDQKFGIKFVKKNGEVREYGECQKAVQYERSAEREGLTAADHRERGNFLFYSHDREGFRIAGFDKIKSVVIGEDVYNVGR